MTFTTLISDMGMFYSITLYYNKGNKKVHKTTFYDSLKIIPFSVKDTAKAFKLPISKLELDYDRPRFRGWKLTEEEKAYITNDVKIPAKALDTLFKQGLTKMTRAANALADYKKIFGENKFYHFMPPLEKEIDKDLRQSYRRWFYFFKPHI